MVRPIHAGVNEGDRPGEPGNRRKQKLVKAGQQPVGGSPAATGSSIERDTLHREKVLVRRSSTLGEVFYRGKDMKWPKILAVLLVGYFGLQVLRALTTTKIRFRLTVNVETPAGPRSGSSVMETVIYRESAFSRLFVDQVRLEGEAVFVDLGAAPDGKRLNLLALLVLGPRGSDASAAHLPVIVSSDYLQARQEARNARAGFRYDRSAIAKAKGPAFDCGEFGDAYCEIARLPRGTRREIQGDSIPTLITFKDPDDPKSALVVDPYSLDGVFGAGFRLQNVTLEFVAPARWPLGVFGMSGEPLTHRIEAALPKILDSFRNQSSTSTRSPSDPFALRREHLKSKS